MDPITLLLVALIGGAGYLYFGGAPLTQSVAVPGAPLPLTSVPAATPSSTMHASGTAAPTASIAAQPSGTVVSPGTVMNLTPATPAAQTPMPIAQGSAPDDSYFVAQALAAYSSATGISSGKYFDNFKSMLTAMVSSMSMSPNTGNTVGTDNCSGFSSTNITFQQIAGSAGTAAETGIGVASIIGGSGSIAAGVAVVAIPVIGAVIGMVMLIGQIFAHHAAAVKKQAQYDCAACAAANNAWQQIVAALASGKTTLAEGYQAFEEVYSQFQQYAGMIANTSQGNCNNPCNLIFICRAVTNKFEARYGMLN